MWKYMVKYLSWGVMMEKFFLSLEKEVFRGNILDVGMDKNGIIYNISKHYDEDIDIDYLEGGYKEEVLKEKYYDTCVLFFSLHTLQTLNQKKKLFKDINGYLKDNGYIYIWDIDKKPLKTQKSNVRVCLPDKSIKDFKINCTNPFTNNSKEKIMNILKDFFEVIDTKHSSDFFSIVCRKKGSLS